MTFLESNDYVVELDNVVKQYGSQRAVNGLSFAVRRGEILAFLGPNGAGKTTTIEMCEGFSVPTSGTIRIFGLDPSRHHDQVRRRIGIMLQGGGSYSGVKVMEMLKLAASYSKNPLDPEWLIDVVGLRSQANTTYRRLSGGQQQRLSLALAIIGRPELVFLDEPTTGLDAQSRLLVWELIQQLRADGVTIIVTTHLIDEAEFLADRVIIIDQGVAVASGSPEELKKSSTQEALRIRTTATFSFPGLRTIKPCNYELDAEITPIQLAKVFAAAAEQEVLITSLDTRVRSLEDVFLEITGKE
ncbi:ATP-binding cassette domain-containing protein [Corynebacterium kutscheri]|uniref:ABC transporter ATP-binding protein n=1 Tax=Corynebacterium kutscheri TaxID=35755 RepID=UPI0037BE284C